MGDLTERCAVLKRERADLNVRHTGLLEETRDLRAYKKATAVRLAALDNREEASDWGDEAAWDLAVLSERRHKSRMLVQKRLTRASLGTKCGSGAPCRCSGSGANAAARCPRRQPCMATSRAPQRKTRATTPSLSSGAKGSRAVLTAGPLSLAMALCASSTPRSSAGSWLRAV